jgi:hypothetical protein
MLKKIALALVLVSAGALPAFAQGACTAPVAPASIDGGKVTIDQLRAAISDAKAFIAASDTYQNCLIKDVADQKAAATKDKPFDPAVEKAEDARGLDNQKLKEKVGADINGAIGDYKKAHPG